MKLKPLLLVVLLTVLSLFYPTQSTFVEAQCSTPYFEFINDVMVIEIESVPDTGDWDSRTVVPGFTGSSYYEWTGAMQGSNPGVAILEYKIRVDPDQLGKYRFQWRSFNVAGVSSTDNNDAWLRMPDVPDGDFYGEQNDGSRVFPKGSGLSPEPEGAGKDRWFKIFRQGTGDWRWTARTSDRDGHDIFVEFNSAGIYTIQISGRSPEFALDRMVLYDPETTSENDATDENNAETITCDGEVDGTPPVITLNGSSTVNVPLGGSYTEQGATATDDVDGTVPVTIGGAVVNTSIPGTYVVTYTAQDTAGNTATKSRTVNVVDSTPPVITLVGSNPQIITVGDAYVEQGATATDNADGNITGDIVIDASAVDTNTLGSYTVTYNVSDSSGNAAAQVTRTVDVIGTSEPVITLTGANPQVIEIDTPYTELGATAVDEEDGDLTNSIVIDASAVNTAVLGTYSVSYTVTDSTNNTTTVERTVNVVDATPPVITLLGDNPQTILEGSSYVELGATAADNVDGDISGSIVIDASAVDTNTIGSYSVTYDVTDSSGNAAVQAIRTVNVVDQTPPVITLLGNNPQTVALGGTYTEQGATATDNLDGDISGSIIIDASAINTNAVGSYTVVYTVTDSDLNTASAFRTVNVVDQTPPVITLLGSNPQTVALGGSYVEQGATATDNLDGDISGSIVIDASAVNVNAIGSYTVTYNVTDAAGNAATEVTRTVNVTDQTPPVITLVGANPQTIALGDTYTELGATATDNADGDITGSIVIDASAVNTNALGSYTVTYNVTDAAGNAATEVTRTVIVEDQTPPEITLIGANPQVIPVGTAYSELGATATDNVDGDVSQNIVIDASAVNTNVLGSYTVTYNVSDAAGNAAPEVTRTVNVVDEVPPVITLSGANPQTIALGSTYTELGATATDNVDGDISDQIVIDASAVNTNALGSYTVTYNVTDSSGNAAQQVTRTVNVTDQTPPVITLTGANPQTIEVLTPYVELGATATDNVDGDISANIVVDTSSVNTNAIGFYTVTYNVTDSAGNAAATVTRAVNVVDTTPPVITLNGDNPQIVALNGTYTESGATATDNLDGDVTTNIVIDNSAVDTSTLGSYTVTYSASDAAGNAVQVTRTVNVTDQTPPIIGLLGNNPLELALGEQYVEPGALASDNVDGIITDQIVIDNSAVDTNTLGSYTVTYNVTDAAGNAATEVTRTVNVTDQTPPVIALLGSSPQTVALGGTYQEAGALASDNVDGDISDQIVIDASAVDVNTLGLYIVTYNVTDAAGNEAATAFRVVNVTDQTPPEITLLGDNPQLVPLDGEYVEQGATATDNADGDISDQIVIDASAVDVNTLGTYTVTYNVTDAAGNAAPEVTRTVNVVDLTPPVITLLGDNPQVVALDGEYVEQGATATDNVDGDITDNIVIDSSAVNVNALGSYEVTYNATDAAGNAATEVNRTVSVEDQTPPVAVCQDVTIQLDENGTAALTAQQVDGGSSDNVAVTSLSVAPDTFTAANIGENTVTLTIGDEAGNTATCTAIVTVADSIPPVITVDGDNPFQLEVETEFVDPGVTVTDNAGGTPTVETTTDLDINALGTYTVTYTATDESGNTATATRTINVVDTTPPNIIIFGFNPVTVQGGTTYNDTGVLAIDNLDGFVPVTTSFTVNTSVVGEYIVTYTATDEQGNESTAERVVNVVDTLPPTAICVDITVELDNTGQGTITAEQIGGGSTDNIGIASLTLDVTTFTNANLGTNTVTLTATDTSGNTATCTATVTVTAIDPLDVNGDGIISPADGIYVMNRIGTDDLTADVNGDQVVDEADFNLVVASIGNEAASD